MTQIKASATTLDAMPEHQADAMMRTLLNGIGRLFEDPKVRADYERWKRERRCHPQERAPENT